MTVLPFGGNKCREIEQSRQRFRGTTRYKGLRAGGAVYLVGLFTDLSARETKDRERGGEVFVRRTRLDRPWSRGEGGRKGEKILRDCLDMPALGGHVQYRCQSRLASREVPFFLSFFRQIVD